MKKKGVYYMYVQRECSIDIINSVVAATAPELHSKNQKRKKKDVRDITQNMITQ